MRSSKKALATLIIGSDLMGLWRRNAEPTWRAYAKKHGYDMIVLTEPIRPELLTDFKTAHWQKCFLLEHPVLRHYQHVVWVDADILINTHRAPCIVEEMRSGKVGIVDLAQNFQSRRQYEDIPSRFGGLINLMMYQLAPENQEKPVGPLLDACRTMQNQSLDHFASSGATPSLNTGVMVLQPDLHCDLLTSIYHKYKDIPDGSDWEQAPLSHELMAANEVEFIDPAFNRVLYYDIAERYPFLYSASLRQHPMFAAMLQLCVTTSFLNSYFLHFVGGEKYFMERVLSDIPDVFQLAATLELVRKPRPAP